MPLNKNGYALFKESPRYQVNFMNSTGGNLNAHFYGNTPAGGYNPDMTYAAQTPQQQQAPAPSQGQSPEDDRQFLQNKFKIDNQRSKAP